MPASSIAVVPGYLLAGPYQQRSQSQVSKDRGARQVNRITPEDVGRRVSVRRRLTPEGGPAEFGDVVGELTGWDAGVLTITRKDGSIARVAEHTLVAGKVVPPVPVRGPSALPAEVLAAASDRAWPAIEYAELGGWLLRAASGFTRRANSVLALGDPGIPPADAVARVRAWYAERGLPTYFQTVVGSATDRYLATEGWPDEAPTIVSTARLAAVRDRAYSDNPVTVDIADVPDAAWFSRYNRAATTGPAADAARAVVSGTAVSPGGTGTVRHGFATVREPGVEVPIAIGRVSVDLGGPSGAGGAGLRVASFTAIETDPAYRRRGLGRAVMAALTDHALAAGATLGLLGVEADNEPALRLYDGLGFTEHHRYHYRREPSG